MTAASAWAISPSPRYCCALLGLLIIGVLTAYKVKGAILYGIVVITVLGIPFGVTVLPAQLFEVPSFRHRQQRLLQL